MALRAANGLLDGVTALLVLLAVVWAGYALWDNSRVYAAADNVQAGLLAFKPQPQEDNSLSFGQLRDINPDVCGWLTLDGTAIDYPVVQGESNFTFDNSNPQSVSQSLKTLKQKHRCYAVMSIDEKLYGVTDLQHIKISAR